VHRLLLSGGIGGADKQSSFGLSAREREVMEHVACGRGNGDIAATLFISQKTVKNHLAHIYPARGAHPRRGDHQVAGDQRPGPTPATRRPAGQPPPGGPANRPILRRADVAARALGRSN
jgi:hypothetical protein